MRGPDITQESLFTTVHLETFVPRNHPLRGIRELMDAAMKRLNWLFDSAYADLGRASIAPERLLRASLLQVLFSIRSERQLVEHIHYNLLYRWFIGLNIDDKVWDHSTFSKNRDRLLEHDVIPELFEEVVRLAQKKKLVSKEHFSVDGTLIQAWASQKSFRPKDDDNDSNGGGRNAERDFHGEARLNETHESQTDPDARSYRKSKGAEARMAYLGHTLMENRNGLIVNAKVTLATGTAEREAAIEMMDELPRSRRRTLGGDKNYDTHDFVELCRSKGITPHVARNTGRQGGSALDERTTRHEGYQISQRKRKRIEEAFGWGKTVGLIRQVKVRGQAKVDATFRLVMVAWNLLRTHNLREQWA